MPSIEREPAAPERRVPIFENSIPPPPLSRPSTPVPPVSPPAPPLDVPTPIVVEPEVIETVVEAPNAEMTTPAVGAEIFLRLSNDERISAGTFESEEAADARARELMALLDEGGEWPRVGGRFVRPDAVVSIDVELS